MIMATCKGGGQNANIGLFHAKATLSSLSELGQGEINFIPRSLPGDGTGCSNEA
jgi:hypothetical protein